MPKEIKIKKNQSDREKLRLDYDILNNRDVSKKRKKEKSLILYSDSNRVGTLLISWPAGHKASSQ